MIVIVISSLDCRFPLPGAVGLQLEGRLKLKFYSLYGDLTISSPTVLSTHTSNFKNDPFLPLGAVGLQLEGLGAGVLAAPQELGKV